MNSIEILYFWHLKLEINYRRLKKIVIIAIIVIIVIIVIIIIIIILIPVLKPGVKLPDSMSEWSAANLYFQTHLDSTKVSQENLDDIVNEMNDVIYKYFKENYGLVEGHDEQIKQLKRKYSCYSKNHLKRQLKRLKSCKVYGLSVEINFCHV